MSLKYPFHTDVIEDFRIRSEFYNEQSHWTLSNKLNNTCIELLSLDDINKSHSKSQILDFGSGTGVLSRLINEQGFNVDVADVCQEMLEICNFATNRFHLPHDEIKTKYSRIILRQVLQYFREEEWDWIVSFLSSKLHLNGVLLYAQIVPFNDLDFEFYKKLITIRRPARKSFPTDVSVNPYFQKYQLKAKEIRYLKINQNLNKWTNNLSDQKRKEIIELFEFAPQEIKSLWNIKFGNSIEDITWDINWALIKLTKNNHG